MFRYINYSFCILFKSKFNKLAFEKMKETEYRLSKKVGFSRY